MDQKTNSIKWNTRIKEPKIFFDVLRENLTDGYVNMKKYQIDLKQLGDIGQW